MAECDFFSILKLRIDIVGSNLCIGIDPHLKDLEKIENYDSSRIDSIISEIICDASKTGASGVLDASVAEIEFKKQVQIRSETAGKMLIFCLKIIDATKSVACCFKINMSFFESIGEEGFVVLRLICKKLNAERLPVILDFKRGDIPSTAFAFAHLAFAELNCDAVTVNPYLGNDSIKPFVENTFGRNRGIFVLCKTSNSGSNDLQLLQAVSKNEQNEIDDAKSLQPIFMHVAEMCDKLNCSETSSNCCDSEGPVGLVVGATDSASLLAVRQKYPRVWILAPGIGAQSGSLENTLKHGLRKDGKGLIIPISRAISQATNIAEAAIHYSWEIKRMMSDIAE